MFNQGIVQQECITRSLTSSHQPATSQPASQPASQRAPWLVVHGGGWLLPARPALLRPRAALPAFGCAGGGRPSWLLRPLLIDLLSQPPAWLMADCLLLLLQICQLLLFSSDTHTILYMNVLYLYLCYILPLPRCIAIVYKTSMTHVYIVYQMKKHILPVFL